MGSNGSRLLARMAFSSNAWNSSERLPTSAPMAAVRLPIASFLSVIRFWVSVPVLSTHKTVAAPSVSMAGMRRVSTRLRESRHAPRARKIVRITGNSSGRTAMAIAIPASSPSFQTCAVPPRVMA